MTASLIAPWLSVLVPVYNVRDYLTECIESVLARRPAILRTAAGASSS